MYQDSEYGQHNLVLAAGETILWHGKPKRSTFIATKSLTLLPIAIIWLIFDGSFLAAAFSGNSPWFIIPFMLVHMFPVWLWLGNVLTASRRWKNTHYYVTNRRIIIQGGFLAVNEKSLFFKDIRNVQMRIGFLDKIFGTGDVLLDEGTVSSKGQRLFTALEDLENPRQVYHRIQKITLDMQTDMEFPNAYRPQENPGYRTEYRP